LAPSGRGAAGGEIVAIGGWRFLSACVATDSGGTRVRQAAEAGFAVMVPDVAAAEQLAIPPICTAWRCSGGAG
jgi:hypothetical protein